jgi:hypothetical protein
VAPHPSPRRGGEPGAESSGGSPPRGPPAKTPTVAQLAVKLAQWPALPTSSRAHMPPTGLPQAAGGRPRGAASQDGGGPSGPGGPAGPADWDRARVVVGRGPLQSAGEAEAWVPLGGDAPGSARAEGAAGSNAWESLSETSGEAGVNTDPFADLGPVSPRESGPPMVPR